MDININKWLQNGRIVMHVGELLCCIQKATQSNTEIYRRLLEENIITCQEWTLYISFQNFTIPRQGTGKFIYKALILYIKNSSFSNRIDRKAIKEPPSTRTSITFEHMLLLTKNIRRLSTHAPNSCNACNHLCSPL